MRSFYATAALFFTASLTVHAASKAPIPIAAVQRAEPVNFEREVLPFLSENCFACHCQTTTKGGLNLESRDLMLKGGDTGPAIVPAQGSESLMLQAAAHLDDDLAMPPRDNKAKAKNLTPEQLGLLKVWIDQGAKVSPKTERIVQWQPMAESLRTIFAVAVTGDGQFAACTRENRICVYHLPSGRCVMNEAAHRDQVNALAFNPDGTLMASGGYREVKLWRRAKDARKKTEASVGSPAAGSPDGTGAAKDDGSIRVSIDSTRFFSGKSDGSLQVREAGKDQTVAQMNHGAAILALAARPDGQRFASAGADKAVKLWAADGKLVAELRGSRYAREAAEERDRELQIAAGTLDYRKQAASDAGKQLTAAQERVKKSSEAIAPKQQEMEAKQKAFADASEAKKSAEQALAASEAELKKAGERLSATEEAAQQAKVALESLTGKKPAPVTDKLPSEKSASDIASPEQAEAAKIAAAKDAADKVAADKTALDAAVADAAAKAQNAARAKTERDQREAQRKQAAEKIEPAGKKISEAEEALEKALTARSLAGTELDLAKAEEQKMSVAVAESTSRIEAAEGARKAAAEALQAAQKAATEAEQPVRALAFSPDNKTLAAAGDDHCVHIWSAETGAPFEVIKGGAADVSSLAFSGPDDLASTARDGSTVTWNLKPEWKLERTVGSSEGPSPLTDRVNALAFSRDGKLLATGSGEPSRGGEIKLWNPADGSLVRDLPNIHSDAIFGLDFSLDGKYLVSGAADKMARVVDLATGKVMRTFEGHTHHVLSVAWSLDGRTLATAGADNMVKVWDFTTGERKKNIEGYDKEVTAVRFAGVSGNLLTSSGDNKVRLVALDGKEIRTFPEVADFMQSAAVTADGKIIVAGGQDGVLRVWNAESGAKIATFPPPKL